MFAPVVPDRGGSSNGSSQPSGARPGLRVLAFYLPQYHPIHENDEWWGKGFTEWIDVAGANPLFRGHDQPHVPADLGFYDLRVPEVRSAQADLARRYGLSGFCYLHYWFDGRRLLGRPFDEVLRSGEPEFPFCLCWANENWARTGDGRAADVLLHQTYSPEDDLRHIRWLAEAFADRRYVRVEGKPVLLVYRAAQLPEPLRTAERWRGEAHRLGIGEIYLCSMQTGPSARVDPARFGFDAAVAFAPFHNLVHRGARSLLARGTRKSLGIETLATRHQIYDYAHVLDDHLAVPQPHYKCYPGISPGFDNSPRRADRGATIIKGSTPALYERWLQELTERFEPFSLDENFVFVNAWNAWAEGNHLEPCLRWGRRYLEAHARVARSSVGH